MKWWVADCAGPIAFMGTDGDIPLLSPPSAITPFSETMSPVSMGNDTPSPAVGGTVNWKGTSEVFTVVNMCLAVARGKHPNTLPKSIVSEGHVLSCEAKNLNVT